MYEGNVKWFNDKKGFGFVSYINDSGAMLDIFVHYTGLTDRSKSLVEGEGVKFDIKDSEKGPVAYNVSTYRVDAD